MLGYVRRADMSESFLRQGMGFEGCGGVCCLRRYKFGNFEVPTRLTRLGTKPVA